MTIAPKVRSGVAMALAGGMLVGGNLLPVAPAQAQPETKFCVEHAVGNGTLEYIVVDQGALQGHTRHGDRFVEWNGQTCDATVFGA
jgi:hypothetical protein